METFLFILTAFLAGALIGSLIVWGLQSSRLASLQTLHQEQQSRLESLHIENEKLKSQYSQAEEQLRSWYAEAAHYKTLAESREKELTNLLERIQQQEASLHQEQTQRATAEARLKELSQFYQEQQIRIEALQQENEALRSHRTQTEEQLRSLYADTAHYKTQAEAMEQELVNLRSKTQQQEVSLQQEQTQRAAAEARLEELSHFYQDYRRIQDDYQKLSAELERIRTQLHEREEKIATYYKTIEENLTRAQKELEEERNRRVQAETEASHLRQSLQERERIFQQVKLEFENLAQRLLKEKVQEFEAQGKQSFESLLQPVREKIETFFQQVTQQQQIYTQTHTRLEGTIQQLIQQSSSLSKQAEELTQALRGDIRMQGQLGEITLERLLIGAGLVEGETYEKQVVVATEDNSRPRPDFIIRLPDGKPVVIDSKVSLTSYEQGFHASNPTEREKHFKAHVDALSRHIQNLSEKDYPKYLRNSPHFVFMFVAIDGALQAALQYRPTLIEEAAQKKVILVSPLTLVPILHMISYLHQLGKQNQNAVQIAEAGAKLYNKLVDFVEEIQKVGRYISQAHTHHENAMRKLSLGRDNLIRQAERMRELGIAVRKQLPESLVADAFSATQYLPSSESESPQNNGG